MKANEVQKIRQEVDVKESAEIQHVNGKCKKNGKSLTQVLVSEEFESEAITQMYD